jgi:hypothetical protein
MLSVERKPNDAKTPTSANTHAGKYYVTAFPTPPAFKAAYGSADSEKLYKCQRAKDHGGQSH